jgi:3-oxoacyl-[acyl-carrier protein] reductase
LDFNGKVAIITGSGRGIGFEIAKSLAKHGCSIVISDIDQEICENAAKNIDVETGVEVFALKANVTKMEEVENLIKKTQEKFGRIDILINNAGITKDNLLLRLSPEDWSKVIDVNLNSVYFCTKAVIRTMLKQRYGKIVNVSSVVGVMGNPGQANYAASKAGILGFTKSIAKEFGAKGITCNAIAPGYIQTEMTDSLPKEYLDNIMKLVPAKRLGTTEDVSNLVLFLASDLSAYITGQVISVDGGMVM